MKLNKLLCSLLLFFTFAASAEPAVKIIVPYSVGTVPDILARQLGQRWAAIKDKPVVIENHTGAAGNIGISLAKAAKPDGQTLLMVTNFALISPLVISPPPFDILTDFVPVMGLSRNPLALAVNRKTGLSNVDELIKEAKRNPGKLTFGAAGIAGTQHALMMSYLLRTKTDMLFIPFKEYNDTVTALINGTVDAAIVILPSAIALSKNNAVKVLAVGGTKRSPYLSDVPTFDELGFENLHIYNYIFLAAPKGTPEAVIEDHVKYIRRSLVWETLIPTFYESGISIDPMEGQALWDYLERERNYWKKLLPSLYER